MALMTRCTKCKKSIPMGETYCEDHKPRKKDFKDFQKKINIVEEEKGKMSARRWRRLRERVIIRDLGCCRMCLLNNFTETRTLEVHHIRKRVDREDLTYDMDNLVTLCNKHHKMLEDLPYEEQIRLLKWNKGR